MAFEVASTNLVAELGIILAILIGWQFTLAEFAGGVLLVALLVLLFRLFLTSGMVDAAREQAGKGLKGKMEGHAEMDMAGTARPPRGRVLCAARGDLLGEGGGGDRPLLRDGLARRLEGHRRRPAARRRPGGLGPAVVLE